MILSWPCGAAAEAAFGFCRGRAVRVLIAPPLFDEMNRTRRWLCEAMRALDAAGIDSVLPDLPGCNESTARFADQTLASWRAALAVAAAHFGATHVLAVRGGALIAPAGLPGWVIGPVSGAALLRPLLRARVLAAREDGRTEHAADLLAQGQRAGLTLAGYRCGAALITGLDAATPPASAGWQPIALEDLGGAALWLRAEPGEDAAQSAALAALIARELAA